MHNYNKRNNNIKFYVWVSILLAHILIVNNLIAQYQPEWIKKASGTALNSADHGNNIAFDKQNNVYVAGRAYNIGSSYDYFLIKYTSAGYPVWSRTYSGAGNVDDLLFSLAADESGNTYVTGTTMWASDGADCVTIKFDSAGNTKWVGVYGLGNGFNQFGRVVKIDNSNNVYVACESYYDLENEEDYLLIKYDSLGEQKWVSRFRGNFMSNIPSDMIVDKSGNIYITGGSVSYQSGWDFLTIKYSPNGDSLWSRRYDNNGFADTPSEMAIDSTGNICITGYSLDNPNLASSLVTIKYDSLGLLKWAKALNSSSTINSLGKNISVDKNNYLYVAGYSTIGPDIVTNRDYLTIRYTPNGDTVWVRRYNGPVNNYDDPNKLTIDSDCNVYVTGVSYGLYGNGDYFTISYDTLGNVMWSTRYNGTANGYDYAQYIALDNAQNLFITGGAAESGTGSDIVTIKYSKNVGIQNINESIPDEYLLYQNYPNPFNPATKINFALPKQGLVTLKIYDITGREIRTLVNEVKHAGYYTVDFNGSNLASGVYFYRIQSADFMSVKKMVLVK